MIVTVLRLLQLDTGSVDRHCWADRLVLRAAAKLLEQDIRSQSRLLMWHKIKKTPAMIQQPSVLVGSRPSATQDRNCSSLQKVRICFNQMSWLCE